MKKVADYLYSLRKFEDIAKENEKNFSLNKIMNSRIQNFIQYYEVDELTDAHETDFDEEGDSIIEKSSSSSYVSPLGLEA